MIFSVEELQWGRERCNCVRNHYRHSSPSLSYLLSLATTAIVSSPLRTTRRSTISKMSLGHEVVVLPRTARLVVAFLLASVLTYACLWLPEVSILSMFRVVRTYVCPRAERASSPSSFRELVLHLAILSYLSIQ